MKINCAYGVWLYNDNSSLISYDKDKCVHMQRVYDMMDDGEFIDILETNVYNSELKRKIDYFWKDLPSGNTAYGFGYKFKNLVEDDLSLFDVRDKLRKLLAYSLLDYDKQVTKYGYDINDLFALLTQFFNKDKFSYLEYVDLN